MELGTPGWLSTLLCDAVAAHSTDHASATLQRARALPTGRARARLYLRLAMRESGLLYGTPRVATESGKAPEQMLFVAVLRTLVRIGLDIAVLAEAPPGPRPEQVLLLLAAAAGQLEEAVEIDRRIARMKEWPLPRKLWRRVEHALEERAMSLSGDPYYGLVLHNGAAYADTQLLGRLAIDYFARGGLAPESAKRRLRFAAQQKAVLVEVLTALVCAERRPSYPARRAILRQIDDLHLPRDLCRSLKRRIKTSFERRPALGSVLAEVRSAELRRVILEQAMLASLVDGRRGPREVAFLVKLAAALGFTPEALHRTELEMAEFYARNRQLVDVFTVSAGAEVLGEELVDSMQAALEKNFFRLLTEVRQTGELSVLLSRAARGQQLTAQERAKMREQLLDVAKAIPALAIFAAPGGLLLLIALAKVLPFSILPSSFIEDSEEDAAVRRDN